MKEIMCRLKMIQLWTFFWIQKHPIKFVRFNQTNDLDQYYSCTSTRWTVTIQFLDSTWWNASLLWEAVSFSWMRNFQIDELFVNVNLYLEKSWKVWFANLLIGLHIVGRRNKFTFSITVKWFISHTNFPPNFVCMI